MKLFYNDCGLVIDRDFTNAKEALLYCIQNEIRLCDINLSGVNLSYANCTGGDFTAINLENVFLEEYKKALDKNKYELNNNENAETDIKNRTCFYLRLNPQENKLLEEVKKLYNTKTYKKAITEALEAYKKAIF